MDSLQREVRLICFDVDGTLVHHDEDKTVWQVLNERFLDSLDANRSRFQAFREGRITYAEWVALDIGEWQRRGVRRAQLAEAIRESLAPVAGATAVIGELRRRGYRLAVVSGTIDLTLELLLPELEFDRVFTNQIFFDGDGAILGWRATPYDMEGKAEAVDTLTAEFGCSHLETAFIGDHWNDLPALVRVGFPIAFRPKEEQVRRVARVVLEGPSLEGLLDLFPLRRRDDPGDDDDA